MNAKSVSIQFFFLGFGAGFFDVLRLKHTGYDTILWSESTFENDEYAWEFLMLVFRLLRISMQSICDGFPE